MAASSAVRVLHHKSKLAVRPEFDLFSAPLTDASIAHTTYESISSSYPLSNEENQVISLLVPRDPVNFIDLSRSYLEIHIRGVGPDSKKEFGSMPAAVRMNVVGQVNTTVQPPAATAPATDQNQAPTGQSLTTQETTKQAGSDASTSLKASTSVGASEPLERQRRQFDRTTVANDMYVPSEDDQSLPDDIKLLLGSPAWTVVNNIGASLFEIVKVNVNEFNLFHTAHYPYQALITKLLNVSRENLASVQGLAYFELEEKNKMNGWSFGNEEALVGRAKAFYNENTMIVYDRLYIPITYSRKLLPNNVSIRVELTQSKNAFAIIASKHRVRWTGPGGTPAVKLQISHLTWHVCKVRPYDYLLDTINSRLLREPALYFFPRRDVRVFIISAESLSFHQIIYQGRKPQSITLAMVEDVDALGNYFATPFGFGTFNLSRCTLAVNNLLPNAPVELTDQKLQGSYRMLADATGHNSEFGEGPLLTPQYFEDGNFLLHYPLTNNLTADAYLESAEICNVNLSLEFKTKLNNAVRLIVLSRFDDFVECVGVERTFLPSYALQ